MIGEEPCTEAEIKRLNLAPGEVCVPEMAWEWYEKNVQDTQEATTDLQASGEAPVEDGT